MCRQVYVAIATSILEVHKILGGTIVFGSQSVFGNNNDLASYSSLYFWNSLEWLLLLEFCRNVDVSIADIFAGFVVGEQFSPLRAEILWYVLFPLIDLIHFHSSAVRVGELCDETYIIPWPLPAVFNDFSR